MTYHHTWLHLSRDDLLTERLQCEQEGHDLTLVSDEFERLLALELDAPAAQKAARELLDVSIALPMSMHFPFHEPDDLEAIRAARPMASTRVPGWHGSESELLDKLHGAWTGRAVGCLLGKPVEGWKRPAMARYLEETGRLPLADYFRYDVASPTLRDELNLHANAFLADKLDHAPCDDDTNYTTTGFAILERYGAAFTSVDVADFWLQEIPLLATCTAERIAYRNFALNIAPPASASHRNPYREWIGAQIRADAWGYGTPGQPQRAAEWAHRDACISHVKNGIYGEMWVAAMTSAAFVLGNARQLIDVGLAQIPANCRLARDVNRVLSWHAEGLSYEEAVACVHAQWDETRQHDWCHTNSNAQIVAIGLLWGQGDFALSICRAVQACFDTDCNGATVGSILGAMLGREALPAKWADHINDTLHTNVAGYNLVKLEEMARRNRELVHSLA